MRGAEWERFPCRDSVIVPVHGEIDIATADAMLFRVLHAAARSFCVVVDLSQVVFFDASAVRALMTAYRRLTRDGVHMVLAEPAAAASRILDALGMRQTFEIYPIVEMALVHTGRGSCDGGSVRRLPGKE